MSESQNDELYYGLELSAASTRFIVGLLENHRTYRMDGIRALHERFGAEARTGYVQGELAKTERALREIRGQCLLD